MKQKTNIQYPIATYSFKCPITGYLVRKGDSYVEVDGLKVSIEGANQIEND